MERVRWLLVLSPLFVIGVTLVILGLGRKKLWKRGKPKDKESADIDMDEKELPNNRNDPFNKLERGGERSYKEDAPRLIVQRMAPTAHMNLEQKSSSGTGMYPSSAATSRSTTNSSIQSASVKSGSAQERPKHVTKDVPGPIVQRMPPTAQRNPEQRSSSGTGIYPSSGDVSEAYGQGNQTQVTQSSVKASQKSRSSSWNSQQPSRSGYEHQPPVKKTKNVGKQVSIGPSGKSALFTPSWSPEGDNSSGDTNRSFKQDGATRARNASTDVPESRQQFDSTTRVGSRRDSDKRVQRGVVKEYITTTQHDQSSSLAQPSEEYNITTEERPAPPVKLDTYLDDQNQLVDITSSNTRSSFLSHASNVHDGYYDDREDATTLTEVEAEDTHQSASSSLRCEGADIASYTDPIKKMFLQKLMALNVTARNISSSDPYASSDNDFDFTEEEPVDFMESDAYNPLDVLCDVLRSSDALLQQEIVTKMSMCQFSIPLLLPAGEGSPYTFMLWAMRDIVKKWKPQSLMDSTGFSENNLVNIPMSFFSFVRLGKCSLSKSKLLNQVLSPPQFIHNYFVHGDMPGGNVQRKCSEGLMEMSCFFPAGRGHSDVFPEPIAVVNLRGDLECHSNQFELISRVSTAMFVFIESMNETQYSLISKLIGPKFYFIVNVGDGNSNVEILEFLKRLSTTHNLKKEKFIVKDRRTNDTQVVRNLQSKIKTLMANSENKPMLQEIAGAAAELNFDIDENFEECKGAKKAAMDIAGNISNVLDYKKKAMKLQGNLWKQLALTEKELCRMRKLEDGDVEEYKSQLQREIVGIRKKQSTLKLAPDVGQFLKTLETHSPGERKVFLKWLKIQLDTLGRRQLSKLNDEYRELLQTMTSNAQALTDIDQKIADGSLGVEHFIRELGQFYEVECFKGKQKSSSLPKTAADLLLDGFPLELIDGDAANIPLQWVTDVLRELDEKIGKNCTLRVITVLGVQSTGKSTLLNTMFGLQLPTSSGRCTRGAFMTLLDAKKNFQEDLGCDYVMVIDTEGLKSMELASLEGSYEHDNELAMVVVGLSDITIINMAMENTEEMKDILQIVIHAFLRMKEVGKKSSCHFVHQNVSDVSAYVNNRKAREKFLEQLNEMTKVSARMEKREGITSFSDVIHCDIENNSWYIPGLWQGIPPMASVSFGYSENVQELKRSLLGYLKSIPGKPQDVTQFTEWMKSLWNAVKHEKFVFSFRNRLVTEAYNQLCIQYSDWEWRFQKQCHNWMMKKETLIFNLSSKELGYETLEKIQREMNFLLDEEEQVMARSLDKYFRDDYDNAHLLEMFRGDFFRSIKYLRKNLENVLLAKCERTIQIQTERCQVQAVQERYIGILEGRVSDIMDQIRNNPYSVNAEQLNREFERIWAEATSTLPPSKLKIRNVDLEMLQQLKQDMQCDDSIVMQKLDHLTSLNHYKGENFKMDAKYLRGDSRREQASAEGLALSVLRKCHEKVSEIANSRKDFNEINCRELLRTVNEDLRRHDVQSLRTTKLFELDLKLCVLGNAAATFRRMNEDFVRSNDPRSYVEEMKPQYSAMFSNMFEKRNECQRRAKQFCEVCLQPAIMDHVNRSLGKEIVDDVLQKNGPLEFKSRKILQQEVLKGLLIGGSYTQYAEYINNYERFMKRWISRHLSEHYRSRETLRTLQVNILQSLMTKITQVLHHEEVLRAKTISEFLAGFCKMLKEELVIPQNNTKVVVLQSNLSGIGQFARDIGLYLSDLEQLVNQDIHLKDIEATLSELTTKPHEELFRMMMGCGKQCPFCKAPCEAGGGDHKEHFASVHRPRGLAKHVVEETSALDHSICSSNVISNKCFRNAEGEPHPYKDYQKYYPDWAIYPEATTDSSDYWRFVLKEFNSELAALYKVKQANIPEAWEMISKEQALNSLRKTYSES